MENVAFRIGLHRIWNGRYAQANVLNEGHRILPVIFIEVNYWCRLLPITADYCRLLPGSSFVNRLRQKRYGGQEGIWRTGRET